MEPQREEELLSVVQARPGRITFAAAGVALRRCAGFAFLMLAGACAEESGNDTDSVVPPARVVQKVSGPGVYEGYSEKRFTERVLESRYVEVRDGMRLAVDIFRPAVDGKAVDEALPVVWHHTPYRRAHINEDGERISALAGRGAGILHLTDYGYVVAAVDTRGRGASFGARRGFLDRTEAQDAYDMTEWFAAQPWSDGNIGIAGCSYNGASTLHAATTAPPHLKAIAPGCFAFDSYRFVARGGIPAQFNTRPENPQQDYGYGVAPVDDDADGALAAAAIEQHHEGTPMGELWRGMPHRDDISPLLDTDFWRETSASTYIDTIEKSGVGIFMWGNWLDEGNFQQVLAFNNLANPRKLWMGGWGHCQVGDFPMETELLRFFDFYLKDIDNGWEDEPMIDYYTINAAAGEEWTTTNAWPPANTTDVQLHLAGRSTSGRPGSLQPRPAAEVGAVGSFEVNYAPQCADESINMYFLFNPCVVDGQGVGFETPALTADLHLLGHAIVDIQVSASTRDADLFAYLEAVNDEGVASIVTHGRLRMSHHAEQDPALDYMGVPYHSGLRADVVRVEPGEVVRMRFDLLPTSTIIEAGTRLRLKLAGADPRQRFRTVEFDPPPVITVHNLEDKASVLSLPVVETARFE